MAKKNINILKEYFETGDKPTQAQFEDLIDSFLHKDSGAVVSSNNYDAETGELSINFSDGTIISATIPLGFTITEIEGLVDALANKVDKVAGKGLSANDYTDAEVAKVQTATEHVAYIPKHVSAADRTNWDGKQDQEAGKGLSSNDYTDADALTVGAFSEHVENAVIHVTAGDKNLFNNKLREYQPGEKFTAETGPVYRFKDGILYNLIASRPFTTTDLGSEPTEWTEALNIPAAGIDVRDGNGISQFLGEVIRFEGFSFEAVNKKISIPGIFTDKKEFNRGIEIGKYDGGSNYNTTEDGLEIYKEGHGETGTKNPKVYVYKGKNRLSNEWQIHHDFMINEEVIARFFGKHQSPYVKYLQVFGSLITDAIANLNGGLKTTTIESTHGITLTGTQYGKAYFKRAQIASNTTATILLETRVSGSWRSTFFIDFINNQGNSFTALKIDEILNGTTSSNQVKVEIKGNLKMDKLDLSALGAYADDAAAATGGIAIGDGYINSTTGALHRRLT